MDGTYYIPFIHVHNINESFNHHFIIDEIDTIFVTNLAGSDMIKSSIPCVCECILTQSLNNIIQRCSATCIPNKIHLRCHPGTCDTHGPCLVANAWYRGVVLVNSGCHGLHAVALKFYWSKREHAGPKRVQSRLDTVVFHHSGFQLATGLVRQSNKTA